MEYLPLLAVILAIAFLGARIATSLQLPRVTGYLLTGIFIGPSLIGLLGHREVEHLSTISEAALGIIAFYIGTEFDQKKFARIRKTLPFFLAGDILVTFGISLLTLLIVSGASWSIALLLGILSIATAPAATLLVIRDLDSEGPLTDHIMALVGLNNLICVIAFVLTMGLTELLLRNSGSEPIAIMHCVHTLARGVLLPIALGSILALLLQYYLRLGLEENELLLASVTAVLLGVGFSLTLSVSPLLTNLTMGGVMINTCDRTKAVIRRLREMDYPLYALFFSIAGASFHMEMLKEMGIIGLAYILSRACGKILGGFLGGRWAGVNIPSGIYLGTSLLPQAGLAIGLSSWAVREAPALGHPLLSTILATTVVFEIFGPILTKLGLIRGGEVRIIKIITSPPIGHMKVNLAMLWSRILEATGKTQVLRKHYRSGPLLVKHFMRLHIDTIPQDATLDEIIKIMQKSRYTILPVVGNDRRWIGLLSLEAIRDLFFDLKLAHLIIARDVAEDVQTVEANEDLNHALKLMEASNLSYLPVVERGDTVRFLGVVHRRDILLFQLEDKQG